MVSMHDNPKGARMTYMLWQQPTDRSLIELKPHSMRGKSCLQLETAEREERLGQGTDIVKICCILEAHCFDDTCVQ